MNKERVDKKRRARERRQARKDWILFLGHHTRPSTKFREPFDWHLKVMIRDFQTIYGKYCDNVYSGATNFLDALPKPASFASNVISIPVSFTE